MKYKRKIRCIYGDENFCFLEKIMRKNFMKIKEKISMSRNIQKIIHIVERKYEKNSKNEFFYCNQDNQTLSIETKLKDLFKKLLCDDKEE